MSGRKRLQPAWRPETGCHADCGHSVVANQSCLETLVKALFRPVPSVVNAVTTTTASTPAITPYSRAVTARRSVFSSSQVLRYSIMVVCFLSLVVGLLLARPCICNFRHVSLASRVVSRKQGGIKHDIGCRMVSSCDCLAA